MNFRYVVICPGGAATGGVELLHQLVEALNYHGRSASILYYPFFKRFNTPEPYKKYGVSVSDISSINIDTTFFIIPETLTHLVKKFGPKQSLVWWMSVDNYINSGKNLYAFKNFLNPMNYQDINRNNNLNEIAGNLYQSEYALQFLRNHGILNTAFLGDYINDDYISASPVKFDRPREDVIVFNPAKGIEQTNMLIKAMPQYKFMPIKNLNRRQVIDLLVSSKIYIDFGNHPGKDRIPREAASLGCVVITNRRGSAMNPVDIPIPDTYKLKDESESFIGEAESLFSSIFKDFEAHRLNFEAYRNIIRCERQNFIDCTLNITNSLEQNSYL